MKEKTEKKSNSNRGQWYYRAHSAHDECFGCGRRWDARKWLCWDCIYTTLLSIPSPPCIHTTATRRICMDELSGIFTFFIFFVHVPSVFVLFSFLGWFIVAAQRCLFECLSCVWIVVWHDSSFVLWLSTSVSLVYVDKINWNKKKWKKKCFERVSVHFTVDGWIDNKLFKVERFTHSLKMANI